MPDPETIQRAEQDKREGKSPTTQAGEFVREEMHHIREGKHGAQSPEQAIAIGLSKARRAGVELPPPEEGEASTETRRKARRDVAKGRSARKARPSARRARAVRGALKRKGSKAASRKALSRHAGKVARRRGPAKRSASARKASRTRGPARRRASARKAARTRQRRRA